MKRCTSPSHFAVNPEEEIKYHEVRARSSRPRERVDTLLRTVSTFYYRAKEPHPNQTSVWIDSEYDQTPIHHTPTSSSRLSQALRARHLVAQRGRDL